MVLPPGSVIGASEIIDWLAFVPTLKLLLPGNAVWMVMPPLVLLLAAPLPLLLVLVVGVWGVCWLFMPFPLAVLLLFDCTNGKLIVVDRSSLILFFLLCENVRQTQCYPISVRWLKALVYFLFLFYVIVLPFSLRASLIHFSIYSNSIVFVIKWSQQCSFRKSEQSIKNID